MRACNRLVPRAYLAALSESVEAAPSLLASAAAAEQKRHYSSPLLLRPRAQSAVAAMQGWSSQHHHLTSTTSSLAAAQAWQASLVNTEAVQVEEWLEAMHSVDAPAREWASGLLTRHPEILWRDAQRVTGVVQALVDATRLRHLLRPYFMQDQHLLALVDRYTPESLRARLSELHRLVWQRLDDPNVTSSFATRTSLDLLDLDAKALALKARALRALVPEFLPSTVLRACPELLDVQVDDLPSHISRAGDVVVIGGHVRVELLGQEPNTMVAIRSLVSAPPPAASWAHSLAVAASPTAGRLLRSARCGAQQLLQEQWRGGEGAAPREVTTVVRNTRQLVYAAGEVAEVRVEDPHKAQEEGLGTACRQAALQRVAVAGRGAGAAQLFA